MGQLFVGSHTYPGCGEYECAQRYPRAGESWCPVCWDVSIEAIDGDVILSALYRALNLAAAYFRTSAAGAGFDSWLPFERIREAIAARVAELLVIEQGDTPLSSASACPCPFCGMGCDVPITERPCVGCGRSLGAWK